MSFPKFFVTYCVMDTEAGANPFGHSCLLFSRQDNENGPVQVIDSIGYYSQPTSTSNPIIKFFKNILGIKFDLQDTHGKLIHEKMRDLNGPGLKGVSFALTKDEYVRFYETYTKIMDAEAEAIEEYEQHSKGPERLTGELERHLKELLKFDLTDNDHDTDEAINAIIRLIENENPDNYIRALQRKIKQLENELRERAPKPRLTHFQIEGVINSTGSYACKQRAFDLLLDQKIIDTDLMQLINGNTAFPRSSEGLSPIHCVSVGKLQREEPRPGKIYYNHVWGPNNAELYLATPLSFLARPGLCQSEGLLSEEEFPFQANQTNKHWPEYYTLVKGIIARIRKVELLLCEKKEASIDDTLKAQLDLQLNELMLLRPKFQFTAHSNLVNLKREIDLADIVLNKATLATYNENYINSFMVRAYASMSAKNALVGLLAVMLCVAVLIAPPAGVVVTIAAAACASLATLYSAKNAHRFFNEERAFRKCKASQDIIMDNSAQVPILSPT